MTTKVELMQILKIGRLAAFLTFIMISSVAQAFEVDREVLCVNADYRPAAELQSRGYDPVQFAKRFFVVTDQEDYDMVPMYVPDEWRNIDLSGAITLWGCDSLDRISMVAVQLPTGYIMVMFDADYSLK